MFHVFQHVNVANQFYLDQLSNEMVDVFGVRIRGIFPVDDVPLHQHPHTFDEHFLPNTKINYQYKKKKTINFVCSLRKLCEKVIEHLNLHWHLL